MRVVIYLFSYIWWGYRFFWYDIVSQLSTTAYRFDAMYLHHLLTCLNSLPNNSSALTILYTKDYGKGLFSWDFLVDWPLHVWIVRLTMEGDMTKWCIWQFHLPGYDLWLLRIWAKWGKITPHNTQHGKWQWACVNMLATGKFFESLSSYVYTRLIGGGTWLQIQTTT